MTSSTLFSGLPKVGGGYSFSSLPVEGSWRGTRSGVQVLPAPAGAPRYGGAQHPFMLEFPINDGGLLFITYHRRRREHRKFTMLLNLLLVGRISSLLPRPQSFWASLPPEDAQPFPENFKWVTEGYDGPLDDIVLDKHSPPASQPQSQSQIADIAPVGVPVQRSHWRAEP